MELKVGERVRCRPPAVTPWQASQYSSGQCGVDAQGCKTGVVTKLEPGVHVMNDEDSDDEFEATEGFEFS